MIKACIFDLDGTLLNTLPTISYYCNEALKELDFEPIETEKYKTFVGNGANLLVKRMLKYYDADEEEYFDRLYKIYTRAYDRDVSYGTTSYDGIPELLAEIKTLDIKTAVISNKPDYATCEAVKTFLGDLIDVAHGGREDVPLKPSPDAVFDIMEELGVKPQECLYIGDTNVDMETGKNAGIFTIGVLWGFRNKEELTEAGADKIVSEPKEIIDYINALQ